MGKHLWQYLSMLYQDIPNGVYEVLVSVFCVGVALIFAFIGWKRGWRKVAGLLLFEIIFLIYSSTVLFRTTAETRGHDFMPFWSYIAICDGRTELLAEIIMNVAVFVPVGLLFGYVHRDLTLQKVLLIGCGISVSIETLQYIFHRGFAETDDVIHNVIGCMMGFGIYTLARYGYERFGKRSVGVII